MNGLPMAARLELVGDRLEMSRQLSRRGDMAAATDQLVGAVEALVGVVADLARRE